MNTYLSFLRADIKNAFRQDSTTVHTKCKTTFEEEMEAVEKWATGIDEPPSLSHQCGLSIEQFPPVETLADDEIDIIIHDFQEMLSTWNMEVDFPSDLPKKRAYPLLINLLNEAAWYLPGGTLHFDFCTGYAPDCELKEYCPCLKHWDDPVSG